jgi:hypothetical protein
MKKVGMNFMAAAVLTFLAVVVFTDCVSSAQKELDALMPRQEQAQILVNPGFYEIAGLDGKKMSNYWHVLPGLAPGRHSVDFYQGTLTTTTVAAGPAVSTTTRVSGNMTVTTTTQQRQTSTKFVRSSGLLTLEHDYEAGKAYLILNDPDGKPVIIPAGYTAWYWEWRKASKGADEAILAINDEHFRLTEGPWPFLFLLDGESYVYFDVGQKRELVAPKGRHTLSIIDKKDPRNENPALSVEIDIDEDELEIEIIGTKNVFNIKSTALQSRFETASGSSPDDKGSGGESILELQFSKKSTLALEIFLDDELLLSSKEKEVIKRFTIPDGPHVITAKLFSYPTVRKEFTASSNLVIAAFKQGLVTNSLEIEEKPAE